MYFTRRKHGKYFRYIDNDGSPASKDIKNWIQTLAIPPAWKDVKINAKSNVKIFVTGRDKNNKKQYIYNPKWRDKRNIKKFERIQRFADQLETMRRVTGQHLRNYFDNRNNDSGSATTELTRDVVLACMLRLLDNAYFRPGNEQYTKENESYGLTTLRSKHLTLVDDELLFEYQGKSGITQIKEIESKRLAEIVSQLDEVPGHRIFKYFENGKKIYVNSDDLNDYIKTVMGEEFSAKDFRTWAATSLAAIALDELDVADTQDTIDGNIVSVVKQVSELLGNSPAICRDNYIDPRIFNAYIDGTTLSHIKSIVDNELTPKNKYLSAEEFLVLKLLESRL